MHFFSKMSNLIATINKLSNRKAFLSTLYRDNNQGTRKLKKNVEKPIKKDIEN